MANCLVKWKPKCLCVCVCVWDEREGWSCEGRERKEGRKERAVRKREGGNERVSPKHLKKHFPLSYHLDVVSGTRNTNVFPLLSPSLFFFPRTVQEGEREYGIVFFSDHWHKVCVCVYSAHMDRGPVGGCDAEIDPYTSGASVPLDMCERDWCLA